jgi:hypothetical protein
MSARPIGAWLLAAGGVAVVASLAAAVAVIGTPAQQRELRLDETRVRDLQQLQQAVLAFRRDEGRLPARLDALPGVRAAATDMRDPGTGAPYGYRAPGGDRYELCARFARASPREGGRWVDADWRHPAGPYCYTRRVGGTAGDPAAKAAAAAATAAAAVE